MTANTALIATGIVALSVELALFVGHRWERRRWQAHRRDFERRYRRMTMTYSTPSGEWNGFAWVPNKEVQRAGF